VKQLAMNQTICLFKSVVSWGFCALMIGFLPGVFGQTLPPLTQVNVSTFTIPFEVEESVIREVELLVSKDRGRRWYSAGRQPVEAGKFTFQADSNGEYWFAFRTKTLAGNVSPMNGLPQLRVLVESANPMIVLSPQSSESGPLTPPRPMRFRDEQAPNPEKSMQANRQMESQQPSLPPGTVSVHPEKPAPTMLGPRLPGLELPTETNRETDLLEDLLNGMSPFLDVQPVAIPSIPSNPVATDQSKIPSPALVANLSVGSITRIFLRGTAARPQIVVRWSTGDEPWKDAQIDILRSNTKEEQPIALNLPNNGEYWWFFTPEDLKPFHVVVRIRSLGVDIHTDITPQAITIDPQSFKSLDGRP
jgi:hypothetical protein